MSSTPSVYRRDVVKRPKIFDAWEQYRSLPAVHYVMELFAEAVSRKNIIPICLWFNNNLPDGCLFLHIRR